MGHSMGGLTINSYLGLNPSIADRLAGVIYSAPFFGIADAIAPDIVKKAIIKSCAEVFNEFVLMACLPVHKVTKNKAAVR